MANLKVLLPTLPSLLIERNHPFIHRDLSWLQFNERVLHEARTSQNPLAERLKFLAITSSNLDEFFMIRMSSLNRNILNARRSDTKLEARLSRIRNNLLEATLRFAAKQEDTLVSLTKVSETEKIVIVSRSDMTGEALELAESFFKKELLPMLPIPEAFQASLVSNLENLQMAIVIDKSHWIRMPKKMPTLHLASSKDKTKLYVFFCDEILAKFVPHYFSIPQTLAIIRLTRDADFTVDLGERDSESIPDMIQSSLRVRDRGRPVRLQYLPLSDNQLLKKIAHSLRFSEFQIQPAPRTFFLQGLWTLVRFLADRDAPTAKAKRQAFLPKPFTKKATLFERLKSKDYLLHHPYDSFDAYVAWIQAACADPQVEMIEQTIYRTDTVSPMVNTLKAAASQKKIRVLIELRARFDELNNLRIAEELRKAGVEVAFGFGKLKLHAKVALVTRREGDQIRRYTHLSTGNYNSTTAQIYTDLGLFTSHPEMGEDARQFFDAAWVGKIPTQFKQLVSAPTKLHRRLLSLIESETEAAKQGRKARIVAKVNALVDHGIIEKLYEASQAGVTIDLIVRGACSLIPGVKGLSENIQVVSLVDRYLEHSRIYYFANSKALYLSSADWMPRNFFSRLELAFPVLDPRLYAYVESQVIPAYLLDTTKARELSPQGVWKRRASLRQDDWPIAEDLRHRKNFRTQTFFEELAENGYLSTPLVESSVVLAPAVESMKT